MKYKKYEIEVRREKMSVYLGEAAPENIWQKVDELFVKSEEEALDIYASWLLENGTDPEDLEVLGSELREIEYTEGIPTGVAYYRANCRNLPE